ncbi:hypothetical protein DB30_04026 [Enhygromyxa salina]|uniref:PPM-type phosphatase domain-containing protein n=1 Tax=Enhygromyxa salina TaxID=215803 RepID=A0A0C1ZGU2_9BACT|nr:hypothetical protein [Enhygromyxa salina]KIG16864.1 hypothetical protein DB30_04026 [Enhygromyxa salina]
MHHVGENSRRSEGPSAALARARIGPGSSCHAFADDELRLYALAEGHGQGPAAEAAAAATLRAVVRARSSAASWRNDAAGIQELFDAAALELHSLRSQQRAYRGMSSSLAVLALGYRRAVVGIVGDCVGFLAHAGEGPRALACGQALLLGPALEVNPTIVTFERRGGDRLLLALGGVLEFIVQYGEQARWMSAEALVEAGSSRAPQRNAGLVSVEL